MGDPEAIQDGRVLRGARSREAIVNAVFELIGEGHAQPTAERVAKRAGVQVRTVFRHFADMETLNLEIATRLRAEVQPLFELVDSDGSAESRAQSLVASRAQVYERMAPYKRSGNTQRWRYEYLQKQHERFVRDHRTQLQRIFPELGEAPAALASALEFVTSFEAWDRLRVDQRLGTERARAAMEHAALAVIGTL
jgi:AcrR family transcriptional regulator